MKNDELLHKWIQGELTEEEQSLFQNRPEYESLVELYKHTASFEAASFDETKMLATILKQPKEKSITKPPARRVFLQSWARYAVAASIALMCMAGYFFWTNSGGTQSYASAIGERIEGQLPDQSSFILNAASELSYTAKTWDTHRHLNLTGEAFFTVKKGATFTVETKNGKVQVLGTAFNVRSRGGVLEVKCASGKVAVQKTSGTTIAELQANEAVRLDQNGSVQKRTIANGEAQSWVEGITRLESVSIGEVVEELERQFAVNIDASAVNKSTIVSCNFQHKSLELALKTALSSEGITFTLENDKKVMLHK